MKRFKRFEAATACALALQIGVAGSALAQDPTSVDVLLPFPEGIPFAPMIVARDQGFFADRGIEVTTSVADGSGYLAQQVVAGNREFALMGASDAVVAFNRRDDVRVLFCNQVNNVYRIVARADTGITSMEGLEGKALGYTEPGGGESQLVSAAIREAGLENNRTITLLPIGPAGPQSLVALQEDTVQAYSSSFPDVAMLAVSGIEWVDITPARYSNVPGTCMVTTEEVLSTEAGMQTAQALTAGWVEGQYHAIENPERGARGGLHRGRVRLREPGGRRGAVRRVDEPDRAARGPAARRAAVVVLGDRRGDPVLERRRRERPRRAAADLRRARGGDRRRRLR